MKQLLFSLLFFALLPGLGLGQVTVAVNSVLVARRVDSLLTVAKNLVDIGKYREALPFAQQAADEAKRTWGENNARYATSLHQQAYVYTSLSQYNKAEELYLKAIDLRAKVLGKEHVDYTKSLNNLAVVYTNKDDYSKAESLYLEAIDIYARTLSKEHPLYVGSLRNLAVLYNHKGDYSRAESLHLEVIEIYARTLGKEHPLYAASLNGLANLYQSKGDYGKVESLWLEAIAIQSKSLGKEHKDYAQSLNNLAILYKNKGDYSKAEPLYLEALAIRAKSLGKDHADYAMSLNNLAVLYKNKGDYEKAESLHLEVIAIRAKSLGKEHKDYAQSLNNLAILYKSKGDYSKVEPLYLEAKEINARTLGKEHPDYASSLYNLANLYITKGDYGKAESLYLETIEIQARTLGKEHPVYARSLIKFAIVYMDKSEYGKAEPLLLEAIEIRAKSLLKNTSYYVGFLNSLAVAYAKKGDFAKAEPLFLEVKEIRENSLGKESVLDTESLFNLAMLNQELNRFPESAVLFLEMNDHTRRLIEKSATYSSESQMLAYLHTFEVETSQFQSFSQAHPSPELIRTNFNNALFFNSYLQENARLLARSIDGADSLTRDAYERWQGCHRRLANEYAKPIAERKYVTEVEAEAEGYEKMLTRNLAAFGETRHAPHWQEVQSALKRGEAAVEFIHYRYYTPKPTDSTMYAALVLRPGWSQPRMVSLFEQRQIQPLLAAANTAATAGQLYATRGELRGHKTRAGQKDEGIVIPDQKMASLYQLIWAPMDSLLHDVTTVYYAPSGVLHRLDLAAFAMPDTKQTLADKYALVQLGSTRQLVVHGPPTATTTHTAALFGGLRYELEKPATTPDSTRQTTPSYDITALRSALGGRGGEAWSYLPGTEKEVKNVAATLGKAGYSVRTLSGQDGSEAAFKMLGKEGKSVPTVLHIATHGFFFPDPKDTTRQRETLSDREPVFKTSDNPLLRSGLVLAGANPAWAGEKTPEGQEDGILTAYEISQMNLSGTELVVLSACETGLGDVEANEGVYGLKRAFKIAGAKYLIMSLWQVPDKQTQELMSGFYKNWLERKMPIPKAFSAAQKTMRKRYDDPFFWAAFVLVE
ncbi:MAG: CHAT domain-containing protein [Phycisphaerae bacterium]|nr:CHAT domain-containing protein [Saprospiraceae bacterium]